MPGARRREPAPRRKLHPRGRPPRPAGGSSVPARTGLSTANRERRRGRRTSWQQAQTASLRRGVRLASRATPSSQSQRRDGGGHAQARTGEHRYPSANEKLLRSCHGSLSKDDDRRSRKSLHGHGSDACCIAIHVPTLEQLPGPRNDLPGDAHFTPQPGSGVVDQRFRGRQRTFKCRKHKDVRPQEDCFIGHCPVDASGDEAAVCGRCLRKTTNGGTGACHKTRTCTGCIVHCPMDASGKARIFNTQPARVVQQVFVHVMPDQQPGSQFRNQCVKGCHVSGRSVQERDRSFHPVHPLRYSARYPVWTQGPSSVLAAV